MLETVDFSQKDLDKSEYKARYKEQLEKLIVLQQQARSAGIGLVVLFEGWAGAGKGSRISDLMYNLDARSASVHVTQQSQEVNDDICAALMHGTTGYFPAMQEFWKALGERGTMTIFDNGWYSCSTWSVLKEAHTISLDDLIDMSYQSVRSFEQQLADDGYIVLKFFVHMTEEGRRKRIKRLYDDPATRWRVSKDKLISSGNYQSDYKLFSRLLSETNFDFAPWTILNGEHERRTNLTIVETLVSAIEKALADQPAAKAARDEDKQRIGTIAQKLIEEGAESDIQMATAAAAQQLAPAESRFAQVANPPRVDELDHSLVLPREDYKKKLKKLQKKLFALENEMFQARVPLILMYEGWDAAGKGGNIKRVAQALDARSYTIFPSPAPTPTELAHQHLWRYWTRLPKAGHVGIYDRSWYGRVLVERVEGFATPEQWARAYDEINEFEHDLVNWGAILLKFWVDVSAEEQLRRFEDRANDPAKQWKITDEDWRNREKYPQYKAAIDDMFRLTSTEFAPWIVLESDDKLHARVKALEVTCEALEKRLH